MSSAVLIITTTKPADTQWFSAANPDAARRARAWTRTQPGYVTSSVQRIAPNVAQNILVFDSLENLNAFRAVAINNADHIARNAYNVEHGITSTETTM